MSGDLFDDVLNVEGGFYDQGYQQGVEDGELAGKIEGRQFGMGTGFDKFLESGRLAGKATVWINRMPREGTQQPESSESDKMSQKQCSLPPLSANGRLEKNIRTMYALVEPETLSTSNTDEAVQDFDDRVKRAQGKAKVIEKTVS
ncbi:hypothetical protein Golomagni_06624 [Golovinomyces magnicellulatus]|nr:hypothetical protein Golomagni_06624 [Golovinomyces magnicellulatus]